MKNFTLLLLIWVSALILIHISCKDSPKVINTEDSPEIQSSYLADQLTVYSLAMDSVVQANNSLKIALDSVKTSAFTANYKIEKIKFYMGLVQKNKSQEKFLRGWINRSLN